ncbi:hypothetical protein [Levilactobacillus huananensis]|uniref:hypothetical protein n=1 Tax=Levilactobacillus huananensis TaxID=2486019 RepID=UPI000F772285|nr:hypothetical protein [Levilactobacillus huananensis]
MKVSQIMWKFFSVVLATVALTVVGTRPGSVQGAVRTKYALGNYEAKKIKVIKNKNYFVSRPSVYATSATYRSEGTFQTKPDVYHTVRGKRATLRTSLYLPVTVHHSGDWADPQSVVITPDGQTAYMAYLKMSGGTRGWIVKYDLGKIHRLLGGEASNMDLLRRASNAYSKGRETSTDKKLLAAIHEGPTVDIGHCQSLAYNPKNKQLWFTKTTGKAGRYGDAVKVSLKTLRPTNSVAYRLVNKQGVRIAVNSNLTFDSHGRAYFSSYSGKHAVRIYRGTMSTKGVHFNLLMQSLANRPGQTHQAIAYNPHNDRLYLVSDDSLSSVPVKKLLKRRVKPRDIQASVFASHREFEGLSFAKNGQGYLVMNRGAELLKLSFN